MGGLKFYHLPSANRKKEGSNPASYPKTAFGIYEIFNKKSGSKNPERLDAVGFAPTASKVLGCCGAGGGTRTHTMLPSADFESATSTIPSHRHTTELYIISQGISSPKIPGIAWDFGAWCQGAAVGEGSGVATGTNIMFISVGPSIPGTSALKLYCQISHW